MRSLGPIGQVLGLEIPQNPSKTMIFKVKIGHFQVKITPWRRGAMKYLISWSGKEISCRFWISNQIFHTIFRSGDIGRSLDPILAIMTKNTNFEDEYLKNGKWFWCAVFCKRSGTMCTTFWPSLKKFCIVVFEKKPKNYSKNHIFGILWMIQDFYG